MYPLGLKYSLVILFVFKDTVFLKGKEMYFLKAYKSSMLFALIITVTKERQELLT